MGREGGGAGAPPLLLGLAGRRSCELRRRRPPACPRHRPRPAHLVPAAAAEPDPVIRRRGRLNRGLQEGSREGGKRRLLLLRRSPGRGRLRLPAPPEVRARRARRAPLPAAAEGGVNKEVSGKCLGSV